MNINEVEVVTGLTRANIRYYEKEGLIEVERLDNKYRNYSSENIRELRKNNSSETFGIFRGRHKKNEKQRDGYAGRA